MEKNKKLIVIVGQTASGKSDLAVKIAKKFNGEVISADSRQIYKGLDIGAGKITKKEMAGVPHHLLNVVGPKKTFAVAQYQRLAQKTIENIWQRGKLPIICGGTGFYIQAVVDGIIIPEVGPNSALRKKLVAKSAQKLFLMLEKKDPARAKTIDKHNKQRLIRALEIIETLGKVPRIKTKPLQAQVFFLGIKVGKKELQKKIHQRILKWLEQGLVQEVFKLEKRGLSLKKIQNFGLVYKWAVKLAKKEITQEDFIKNLEKDIWHYAKRQLTWFRRDKRIKWFKNKNQAEKLIQNFLK